MTGVLGRLFAVAEDYPELKANPNFLQLQDQLSRSRASCRALAAITTPPCAT